MPTYKQKSVSSLDWVDGRCFVSFRDAQPAMPERGFTRALPPMVVMDGVFTAYELRAILDALENPSEGEPFSPCGLCQVYGASPHFVRWGRERRCRDCQRTEDQIVAAHGCAT